jgi:hypothetical protein
MGAVRDIGMACPPGISPERACDVRARAWAFVFRCWQEKQNAAGVTGTNGDDAKERSEDDSSAKTRIP